jgi:hypothetical protein
VSLVTPCMSYKNLGVTRITQLLLLICVSYVSLPAVVGLQQLAFNAVGGGSKVRSRY